MTPAGIGARVGAYLIDALVLILVVGCTAGLVIALTASLDLSLMILAVQASVWITPIAWGIVYTLMQGGAGSLGMRAVGIVLVRGEAGVRLGFWRALLRNIIWNLATSIIVGYFTVFFDSSGRRQGWHDKVADAVMLSTRNAAAASQPAPPTRPVGLPAAPPAPVAPVAAEGMIIASVPGITPASEPQRSSEPVPSASAPARPATDEIDATRLVNTPNAVVLVWDDGVRHTVSARTLFGRNPATNDGAATVAVRDETLSLSKTHFAVDTSADGAWLTDLHSTNGVTIVRAGRRILCVPGGAEPLVPGDALEIGERVVTLGGGA